MNGKNKQNWMFSTWDQRNGKEAHSSQCSNTRKEVTGIQTGKGFPGGSDSEESASYTGDPDSIPGLGKIPWRKKWQPTPVFLPGESHRQRSLVGYSPWGRRVRHDWVTNTHTHTHTHMSFWASLLAQLVKNPPAIQETLVRFLGQEDPLEKGIGYPLQYSWASLVA